MFSFSASVGGEYPNLELSQIQLISMSISPHPQGQPPKYYYLESLAAGKVLDVSQDQHNRGQLIIYEQHQGTNQHFAIQHTQLEVMFRNRQSGLYLTIANNSDKNGAVVVQQPGTNQRNQKYRLQEISPNSGQYVIFTFCGKALDICQNSWKNGTRIIQWDFHGKDNQKWMLKQV